MWQKSEPLNVRNQNLVNYVQNSGVKMPLYLPTCINEDICEGQGGRGNISWGFHSSRSYFYAVLGYYSSIGFIGSRWV